MTEMRTSPFVVVVSDLLGSTGARRTETLVGPLEMNLAQVNSDGDATAIVTLEAMADGLIVRGSVDADVKMRCNRCLTEIPHHASASITQAYGLPSDDDFLSIGSDGSIDLEPILHDELSLSFPLVPVCLETCAGLCPTCGTDLNKDPCDGHPEESSSPFAVLQDLFDAESDAESSDA
jgi:uncharacterized protein